MYNTPGFNLTNLSLLARVHYFISIYDCYPYTIFYIHYFTFIDYVYFMYAFPRIKNVYINNNAKPGIEHTLHVLLAGH